MLAVHRTIEKACILCFRIELVGGSRRRCQPWTIPHKASTAGPVHGYLASTAFRRSFCMRKARAQEIWIFSTSRRDRVIVVSCTTPASWAAMLFFTADRTKECLLDPWRWVVAKMLSPGSARCYDLTQMLVADQQPRNERIVNDVKHMASCSYGGNEKRSQTGIQSAKFKFTVTQ